MYNCDRDKILLCRNLKLWVATKGYPLKAFSYDYEFISTKCEDLDLRIWGTKKYLLFNPFSFSFHLRVNYQESHSFFPHNQVTFSKCYKTKF